MPKFEGCERHALQVAKIYEVFDGHEVGKVILISSTNLVMSSSCRFVDQKYIIAIQLFFINNPFLTLAPKIV